jgi:hypothetical protein
MEKHKNNQKYKEKRVYKRKQILILIILFVFSVSLITIFARYVTDNINNFFVRTKDFYFNSDKLTEDTAIYKIDNWSGVDSYSITVNMNSRKNNLVAVDYDISYDISYTCSSNANCELSKSQGIIYSTTNDDTFSLIVTPIVGLDTGDQVIVEITAKSTSYYTKTLKAKFILEVGKEDFTYQITDSSQSKYMQLRITNTLTYYNVKEAFGEYKVGQRIDIDTYLALTDEQQAKCYSKIVTISFNPEEVTLDTTSSIFNNIIGTPTMKEINGQQYISAITIWVDAISSEDIRFYKSDVSQDYTYPNNNNESILTITSI